MSPRFEPLLCCLGIVWVLSACGRSPRPSHLGPEDVVGCYLVSAVVDADYRGLFPDTIALISAPTSQLAGAYRTRITLGQAGGDSTLSLAWRMIGADSLEIIVAAASFAIDLMGRLTADGFAGTATFEKASHSTTGAVTAMRAHCLGL